MHKSYLYLVNFVYYKTGKYSATVCIFDLKKDAAYHFRKMSFSNKVVVVTGAGSGIGKAISLSFANLSATLSLFDVNGENLEKCSKLCEKLSKVKVLKHVIDLQNDELVRKAVDDTIKVFSKIDVVVNCAGIYKVDGGAILNPKALDVFDQIMAVNLRAVVCLVTCVAPELIKSQGCIVNISSVSALIPSDTFFAYSVSKAAVCHFTKCAALELAPYGVRVNAVLPGGVETNILRANAGVTIEQSHETMNAVKDASPLKRLITSEEVADLVVFLAGDGAKSITGSNYTIDSGLALIGQIKG